MLDEKYYNPDTFIEFCKIMNIRNTYKSLYMFKEYCKGLKVIYG